MITDKAPIISPSSQELAEKLKHAQGQLDSAALMVRATEDPEISPVLARLTAIQQNEVARLKEAVNHTGEIEV